MQTSSPAPPDSSAMQSTGTDSSGATSEVGSTGPAASGSPLGARGPDNSAPLHRSLLAHEDDEFRQLAADSDDNSSGGQQARTLADDVSPMSSSASQLAPISNSAHLSSPSETLDTSQSDERPGRQQAAGGQSIELRFLVRRREAGALIGKRGTNIKRLRELFKESTFSIPDTGNGPERVVSIVTNSSSLDAILNDLAQMFLEKSPERDEQIELKLLIHSSHAGSIIGIGGQSIKKLRNDSKAAIKIFEMCCPLSSERVCAVKAKPPVVVSAIKLIHTVLAKNPIKGTLKPYDAFYSDLSLVDKYGGYLPDDCLPMDMMHFHHNRDHGKVRLFDRSPLHLAELGRQNIINHHQPKHFSMIWRSNGMTCGASRMDISRSQLATPGQPGDQQAVANNNHCIRLQRFHPYAPINFSPSAAQLDYQHHRTHHHLPIMSGQQQHRALHLGGHQLASAHGDLGTMRPAPSVRPFGPPRQQGPGLMSVSQVPPVLHDMHPRCRHPKPCLCLFLPMMPADVLRQAAAGSSLSSSSPIVHVSPPPTNNHYCTERSGFNRK